MSEESRLSRKARVPASMAKGNKRRTTPRPLVQPPHSTMSRKRARVATTKFHKYTQELASSVQRARQAGCRVRDDGVIVDVVSSNLSPKQLALVEEVKQCANNLEAMGGREEYQRASQLNTSLFSTSKWLMGLMGSWGWLEGLKVVDRDGSDSRRDVRILEIGAINTQLLDAAKKTRLRRNNGDFNGGIAAKVERVYRLNVRAIDIRSTDPRIEQSDFFALPNPKDAYDAIVCSMVINCVTSPQDRGKMLTKIFNFLRPGGKCFLTLPRLCLHQSKTMTRAYFEEILTKGVGFEIMKEATKDSPKIAFYVLSRPMNLSPVKCWSDNFGTVRPLKNGKKFRNSFTVILSQAEVERA